MSKKSISHFLSSFIKGQDIFGSELKLKIKTKKGKYKNQYHTKTGGLVSFILKCFVTYISVKQLI